MTKYYAGLTSTNNPIIWSLKGHPDEGYVFDKPIHDPHNYFHAGEHHFLNMDNVLAGSSSLIKRIFKDY